MKREISHYISFSIQENFQYITQYQNYLVKTFIDIAKEHQWCTRNQEQIILIINCKLIILSYLIVFLQVKDKLQYKVSCH